jgi:hypothetical protein
VALLVGAAIGFRYALPPLEALNLDPLSRWREPKVAVDIEPRSGPVIVTIEFLVREEDVVAFLSVMAERRRIRRRDGARHWTLLRDLTNSELWIERYDTPTWVEYVRQNQRVTQADAEIGDRVRALHKGPNPPVVHRMIERQTGSLPGAGCHQGADLGRTDNRSARDLSGVSQKSTGPRARPSRPRCANPWRRRIPRGASNDGIVEPQPTIHS